MSQPVNPLWLQACNHACRTAREAWSAIEPYYCGDYQIFEKADGPATEADRLADLLIVEHLARRFPEPDYGFLTEESEDRLERLERERVWIIDPIDGTKEFIAGSGNFAIHIGMVERLADGAWHPVVGVVYRPVAGLMYYAVRGQGAWRRAWAADEDGPVPFNPETGAPAEGAARLSVSPRDHVSKMRSVLSNTHRTSRLVKLIQSLGLEDYWHIGSMGVKLAIIAEGDAELYINLGGGWTKEWDTCAPHLILSEAGGRLTDLNGTPLGYNQRDVYHHNGLLASNGIVHDTMVEIVRDIMQGEEFSKR